MIGSTVLLLINESPNNTINCTNLNVYGSITMFGGNMTNFSIPANTIQFGCTISLYNLALSEHLSPEEMDQLLFRKTN